MKRSIFLFKLQRFLSRLISPGIVSVLAVAILTFPTDAKAHHVTIFAWVEGDTVFTESNIGGGKRAKHAPVVVLDEQGNKLLEGETDENGEFSFKIPEKTALEIVLDAGPGHRASWHIPLEEIAAQQSAEAESASAASPSVSTAKQTVNRASSCLSAEELTAIVESAVDRRTKEIVSKLHRLEKKEASVTIKDVLGGIGYIIGLIGLGAYIQYRKKTK